MYKETELTGVIMTEWEIVCHDAAVAVMAVAAAVVHGRLMVAIYKGLVVYAVDDIDELDSQVTLDSVLVGGLAQSSCPS